MRHKKRRSRASGIRRRRGSLHYQAYADFSLSWGIPQLVSTSISSCRSACTSVPFNSSVYSTLTISRIFQNLDQAVSYINYLHGIYPHSHVTPPIAYLRYEDGGQKELFKELSK